MRGFDEMALDELADFHEFIRRKARALQQAGFAAKGFFARRRTKEHIVQWTLRLQHRRFHQNHVGADLWRLNRDSHQKSSSLPEPFTLVLIG
jgi:hypothetical protein